MVMRAVSGISNAGRSRWVGQRKAISRTSAISVSSDDVGEGNEGGGGTVVIVGARMDVGKEFTGDCRLVRLVEAVLDSSLTTEFCLFRHFACVEGEVYTVDVTVVVTKFVVVAVVVAVVMIVTGSGRLGGDWRAIVQLSNDSCA